MTASASYHSPLSETRRVLREGTFNARDAGGYPLAGGGWLPPGRLYRSDALSSLTQNDLDEFGRLGIRTVIDLRDRREVEGAPDILDRQTVRYERIPIFEDRLFERDLTNFPTLLGQYQIVMDEHVHQLVRVLSIMSEVADEPVLVHCTAGKDRTGLILALTHAVVGLAPNVILEDYGASEQILTDKFEEKVRELYKKVALPTAILGENPRHAPPAYLERTLEAIHGKHGSIPEFLEDNGLARAAQERLASNLLRAAA